MNAVVAPGASPPAVVLQAIDLVKHFPVRGRLFAPVRHVHAQALQGAGIASIGPVTSATLREYGFEPTVEAEPHTMDALIAAIVDQGRSA